LGQDARVASTTEEIEQKRRLLANHAVLITDEGPMRIKSREEVKDVISHHFGIRKHVFYVYRHSPDLVVAVFVESHDRGIIFVAARVVEGPIELGFHAWT
jgi:hypothetical protein